jgi:uncharacterized RDD family membrane protein YckC
MNKTTTMIPASFLRRLGAWLYDGLIVTALSMLAGAIGLGIAAMLNQIGIIDLTQYVDISDYLSRHPIISPIYTAYLFALPIFFYAYFWCKHGQTLGMQAWRLKLQNKKGENLRLMQALIRMATSGFGLGNLLVLINQSRQSLQDLMAECEMVYLPTEKKKGR